MCGCSGRSFLVTGIIINSTRKVRIEPSRIFFHFLCLFIGSNLFLSPLFSLLRWSESTQKEGKNVHTKATDVTSIPLSSFFCSVPWSPLPILGRWKEGSGIIGNLPSLARERMERLLYSTMDRAPSWHLTLPGSFLVNSLTIPCIFPAFHFLLFPSLHAANNWKEFLLSSDSLLLLLFKHLLFTQSTPSI